MSDLTSYGLSRWKRRRLIRRYSLIQNCRWRTLSRGVGAPRCFHEIFFSKRCILIHDGGVYQFCAQASSFGVLWRTWARSRLSSVSFRSSRAFAGLRRRLSSHPDIGSQGNTLPWSGVKLRVEDLDQGDVVRRATVCRGLKNKRTAKPGQRHTLLAPSSRDLDTRSTPHLPS
jgi:hypothetical protein